MVNPKKAISNVFLVGGIAINYSHYQMRQRHTVCGVGYIPLQLNRTLQKYKTNLNELKYKLWFALWMCLTNMWFH